jgi:hypothetical protein
MTSQGMILMGQPRYVRARLGYSAPPGPIIPANPDSRVPAYPRHHAVTTFAHATCHYFVRVGGSSVLLIDTQMDDMNQDENMLDPDKRHPQ